MPRWLAQVSPSAPSMLLALLFCAVGKRAKGQDLFIPAPTKLFGSLRLTSRREVPEKPNIVWFLTDDQDQLLGGSFPPTAPGGATPMPRTKRLMQDEGLHATNWYIHTPICSPSRSELLTGRYFHNIKKVGAHYMHVDYEQVYNNSFVRVLQEQGGYTTGLFGKYVNVMPKKPPPGFDAWLANAGGDYIAPSFQTKNIDGLPDGQVHLSSDPGNYTTAVVGNASVAWIRKVAKQGKPFMAYIAPKAAHEPFNPAPWYRDHWDASWPEQAPRTANWNVSAASRAHHHGNVGTEPLLTPEAAHVVDGVFKNRWRTLMSVDDVIGEVIAAVEELGLSDSTYFLYSSDHGFQLGQFNIPMDKRHVYEWDTKIHLLARGPGIAPGTSFAAPGTQVDIAPTLLGLAGLPKPPSMDGRSIVPFLLSAGGGLQGAGSSGPAAATKQHLVEVLGDMTAEDYAASWRQEVFIEYYFVSPNVKCMTRHPCLGGHYPKSDANCVDLTTNEGCWCIGIKGMADCYATEDRTNNFIALRRFAPGENELYAEFEDGNMLYEHVNFKRVDFVEHYNLSSDPWHMQNLAEDPQRAGHQAALSARLREWLQCSGDSCF
mmetsp:Transcript_85128/g.214647  ORF Transcript_85128/g.214647 Transcript_85128/m.214647 type:complete len:600 (+) Transcript_85128:84-1883(+)